MTQEQSELTQWAEQVLEECMASISPAQELVWLQRQFDAIGIESGLTRKNDVDRLIFQKMHGRTPERDSEILKIRYWRTGRHKPQSRQQCLELSRALNLDDAGTLYLLQYYYDAADQVFDEADTTKPLYQKRLRVMQELEIQYLTNADLDYLENIGVPWDKPLPYLRHCYFQDAARYISGSQWEKADSHLSSANFVHEFQKTRRLLGEIPRKTILRHLFLLSAPYLSVAVMNDRLTALGYAPLTKDHETRWGERLDGLLLRLLERYESACSGKTPDEGLVWLQQACREIDEALIGTGHTELQFLRFKALKSAGSK